MSDTICVVPIPGPQGPAGADGADGTDGISAVTYAANYAPAAQPVMPAEGGSITINTTGNTNTFQANQFVYVEFWGYMKITAVPSDFSLTLQNPENTASLLYPGNSAPGTSLTAQAKISPTGEQGPAGAAGASGAPVGATFITQTPDATLTSEQALSTLATGLLRNTTGTGVLSIATDGTHYLSPTTGLEPADLGVTVQAYDALLAALAALVTANDRYIYFTGVDAPALGTITAAGRAILDDADAAAQRNTLGVLAGYGLLASADAVDLNSATTDTALTVNATRYLIDKITLENVSAALALATAGVFTAAGGGGTTLCADQPLAATLTATTKIMHLTKQAIVDTDSRTNGTLYFRVGTADGAARTVSVKIYGWKYA